MNGPGPPDGTAPPDTAMFASLTELELLVLSSKSRRGARRARRAMLQARSLPRLQAAIRLASSLAQLDYEIEQEIASRRG